MILRLSELNQCPTTPGIYKMVNAKNDIIYVGKAKHLKNRVRSYFNKNHPDLKTKIMVSHINTIEIIQTTTEKEAFILENQLIKTLKPKYNILLKDDKTFPYIKITTNEPFPRILTTRKKIKDGARYYGPYPSIGSTRSLKKTLYELFPLRDCKLTITLTEQQPKCLLLDIGKCIGPCIYKDIKPSYDHIVEQLHLLLTGKNKSLLSQLTKQMKTFSNTLDYEKAAETRDKIKQITQLIESQQVSLDNNNNLQLWAFHKNKEYYYMLVQEIIDGKLIAQHGFYHATTSINQDAFIEQTFISFQSQYMLIPDAIVTTSIIATVIKPILMLFPQNQLVVPEKGLKKQLLAQTEFNAKQALSKLILNTLKTQDHLPNLADMQQQLQLSNTPKRIIGFDISHIQGEHMVGSAVCFVDGKPAKHYYRKFNIKTVKEHSNDPAAIAETVYRRLNDAIQKKEPLPDLLCIDGGRAQLNFAYKSLKALNLTNTIDIISLAKRDEEIYLLHSPNPLKLPKHNSTLRLLQQIRDESHRFANSFRHQKHSAALTHSQLLEIPGLGKTRINDLYKTFGSIDHIKKASIHDITNIPSIGPTLAKKILNHLLKAR